jgi:hypothetical protein
MFGQSGFRAVALATLLSAASLMGSTAGAATIKLTSTGNATGDDQAVGSFSSGTLSGTITAGCDYGTANPRCDGVDSGAHDQVPTIQITKNGMGVDSTDDGKNSTKLDSSNQGEFLTFTFAAPVDLLGINLAGFDSGSESYDLYINGALYADDSSASLRSTSITGVTSLTIVASSGSFKVKNIKAVPALAPVPLPAGGLLLAGALGGIGLARRRRRA